MRVKLRPIDLVWNRAATERGGSDPRTGDAALAAMLRCHNAVMSGGMAFAVTDSLTPEEIASGLAGFEYFGLIEAARVFGEATTASDEELDQLDVAYDALVPTDQVLVRSFEGKFNAEPEQFGPLQESA